MNCDLHDPLIESIRRIKLEADKLTLAVMRNNTTEPILHISFDRGVKAKLSHVESQLLRKIK